ncbi:MAG: hypothetical protein ACYTBV_20600 [Planctomycetota bacterium]|jgi:hypothetical protein
MCSIENNEDRIEKKNANNQNDARLEQAVDKILQAYSTELLIKKVIWWVCGGLQTILIFGSMIILFHTQSLPIRLLCVVIALIAHEGMVVAVLWTILTYFRIDMLRELKNMELQLSELRVSKDK